MQTVIDILSELGEEIASTRGRLEALQSFQQRIATAKGLERGAATATTSDAYAATAVAATILGAAPVAGTPVAGVRTDAPKRRRTGALAHRRTDAPPAAENPGDTSAVRSLPEPFTAAALQVGLGLKDLKAGSNRITRWLVRGWIERCGRGQYRRTANFGLIGVNPPA
jgi:hypothetical protein